MPLPFLKETLSALRDALGAPVVTQAPIPHPNGRDYVLVVRKGDRYETESLAGPKCTTAAHRFTDLEDFATFVNRRATDKGTVDVVFGDEGIRAGFQPGHAESTVVECDLQGHPMYSAWVEHFGVKLTQRGLHEFLIAFGGAIVGPKGGAPGPIDELTSGLAALAIDRGGNYVSELGAGGYVKLQSSESKNQLSATLPTKWEIDVPVFEGIRDGQLDFLVGVSYRIQVLLSIDVPKEGSPSFKLSAPGLPLVLSQAWKDVGAYLRSLLDDEIYVGNGSYRTIQREVHRRLLQPSNAYATAEREPALPE